jgi:hypothetical protein
LSTGQQALIVPLALRWDQARDQAHAWGGELASIHDATTLRELQAMLRNWAESPWVGLYRPAGESATWSDGSPHDFIKLHDNKRTLQLALFRNYAREVLEDSERLPFFVVWNPPPSP